MAYVPTGFPRGRPRKGEIRPPTPGGVQQAKWRERQLALNPEEYRAQQAMYQQLWHLANPGAKAKSQKAYEQREVHWQAVKGKQCKVFIF